MPTATSSRAGASRRQARWVANEHGIHVDQAGLRLDRRQRRQRQRHLQVHQGRQAGADRSASSGRPAAATTPTLLGRPADIQVDDDANEVFVADGYGNRRVIVFDSETGAYKRHWGAYGNKPNDDKQPAYDPAAPPRSSSPTRCIAPSRRRTASSMSATAPTTASRCSRRTAPSSPSGSTTRARSAPARCGT